MTNLAVLASNALPPPPGVNWRPVSGLNYKGLAMGKSSSSGPRGICWASSLNLFVLVGCDSFPACMTSPDGINWTGRQSFSKNIVSTVQLPITTYIATPRDICWSGTKFVAVCAYQCGTSTDGINWTAGNTTYSSYWGYYSPSRVIWADTQFIAVGEQGKCQTSPDGVTWTNRTSLASAVGTTTVVDVVWSGTQFVAICQYPSKCATSPDGVTWTAQPSLASVCNGASAICWSGTQFVVCSMGNGFFTSPDGITWTLRANPASCSMKSIHWNGTQYVASGSLRIYQSTDGITWNFVAGIDSDGNRTVWNGSIYLTGGGDSAPTGNSATSPNGITWTLRYGMKGADKYILEGSMVAIRWTGSSFLGLSYTGTFYTSTDGLDWVGAYQTGLTLCRTFGSSGTIFVVINDYGYVRTSPDLVTWTNRASISSTPYEIIWTGSQFVAVGGGTNKCFTSPDGITWTARTSLNTPMYGKYVNSIAWSGSMYVAVGEENGNWGTAASSPDAITWTRQGSVETIFSSSGVFSVVWTGSLFVITGPGKCATSPDGITWTARTFNGAGTKTIWTGSKVVSVSSGNPSSLCTSADGITWSYTQPFAGTAFAAYVGVSSLAYASNHYVLMGAYAQGATSP